jgi:transcriptional regulator with XRE-family HTH domain
MGDDLARRVGQRVRFARQAAHQTQAVVAGLSGITTDYLYQIERGKKLPTLPVLVAIAAALGTSSAACSARTSRPPRCRRAQLTPPAPFTRP